MSNIQIESDLKEILNKLDGKLDNLQKDVTDINLRLTKVETKLDSGIEDLREIKGELPLSGAQKAQIWTLIGILFTAVGGFIVAVGRPVLSFNP
jgi:copper chaperone CopZ